MRRASLVLALLFSVNTFAHEKPAEVPVTSEAGRASPLILLAPMIAMYILFANMMGHENNGF